MTPPAMRAILDGAGEDGEAPVLIDGFIGPAHVSTVIGHGALRAVRPRLSASRW